MGSIDRMGSELNSRRKNCGLGYQDDKKRKTACECHVHILSISAHHGAGTNEIFSWYF